MNKPFQNLNILLEQGKANKQEKASKVAKQEKLAKATKVAKQEKLAKATKVAKQEKLAKLTKQEPMLNEVFATAYVVAKTSFLRQEELRSSLFKLKESLKRKESAKDSLISKLRDYKKELSKLANEIIELKKEEISEEEISKIVERKKRTSATLCLGFTLGGELSLEEFINSKSEKVTKLTNDITGLCYSIAEIQKSLETEKSKNLRAFKTLSESSRNCKNIPYLSGTTIVDLKSASLQEAVDSYLKDLADKEAEILENKRKRAQDSANAESREPKIVFTYKDAFGGDSSAIPTEDELTKLIESIKI